MSSISCAVSSANNCILKRLTCVVWSPEKGSDPFVADCALVGSRASILQLVLHQLFALPHDDPGIHVVGVTPVKADP